MAIRSLNHLNFSMYGCGRMAKCAAYKAIVRPSLKYAAVVRNPHTKKDINLLESLQNRAARWICGSWWSPATNSWTISSGDCCSQLSLLTLQARQQFLCIYFLYDIYHHHTSINFDHHFQFNSALSTRSYHLSLFPPSAYNIWQYLILSCQWFVQLKIAVKSFWRAQHSCLV